MPRWWLRCTGRRPIRPDYSDPAQRAAVERALAYMALEPGTRRAEIGLDRVFIGSCTNSRIEDLQAAAAVVAGRRVHPTVSALVVPGSAAFKRQAEEEGLDRMFRAAGLEWRRAGCSMCLGVNPDVLKSGERCARVGPQQCYGRADVIEWLEPHACSKQIGR